MYGFILLHLYSYIGSSRSSFHVHIVGLNQLFDIEIDKVFGIYYNLHYYFFLKIYNLNYSKCLLLPY